MKMIKRTLIILIIATTIFTVVKCNRIENADNIKQEQGEEDKEEENKDNEQDKEEKPKDDKSKEEDQDDKEKEEIKSPVELG